MRAFLTSSDHPLPQPDLIGHAFQGRDLVMGADGVSQYGDVSAGEDGAYVSLMEAGRRRVVVGTDRTGYRRLFVYRRAGKWALGSSLIELAEHVVRRGWPLTPIPTHLHTFMLPGLFANQLTSFETVFREIRLLPAYQYLVISRGAFGSKLEAHYLPRSPNDSYQALLGKYLSLLVGRMGTLLSLPEAPAVDITGGRDSRVVLGAMLVANRGMQPLGDQVAFQSGTNAKMDLAIAWQLSDRFELKVNTRARHAAPSLSGRQSYNMWRLNNLGIYGPIYFPRPPGPLVTVGGIGAEANRIVFRAKSMDTYLERGRENYTNDREYELARSALAGALAEIDQHDVPGLDQRVAHYRNYRDRIHGGRLGHYSVNVTPLASRYLRAASNNLAPALRERSQVAADMLHSFSPELANYPYDDPAKGFDDEHRKNLTLIKDIPREHGAFYGTLERIEPESPSEPAMTLLASAHAEAMHDAEEFVPSGFIVKSSEAMTTAEQAGRFRHAIDGQPVSTVTLAATMKRLAV